MPARDRKKSKVEGLYKRCSDESWDRCQCEWWGRVRKHRVPLAKWSRKQVPNKLIAKAVVTRMRAAVLDGTFDPRGEHPEGISNSTLFSDFLDEYVKQAIQAKGLRSNSINAYIGVFRAKFGNEKLGVLAANRGLWEDWLNDCRNRGTVSEDVPAKREKWADATYLRYIEHVRRMFNWARRRKLVSENPFEVLDFRPASNRRERRITPKQEQQLLDACDTLDMPAPSRLVKVTPELVTEIRTRAEGGELQKSIASSTGLSRSLICQIVNGQVWNPSTRSGSIGREMKRRLVAGLDSGLRRREMLALQVQHVDYEQWYINLPSANAKAKRDQRVPVGSERLKQVLIERRSLGPEGFVFGREDGGFVASFNWERLFTRAGLPVGRKGGYVWHDLRHEYVSHLVDVGARIHEVKELARHADIRTTDRYMKADEDRKRRLMATLGQRLG